LQRAGGVDLVTVKEDDRPIGFRITDAGFHAINQDPPGAAPETPPTDATTAPHVATDDAVAQEAATVADALDAAPVAPTVAAAPPRTKTTLRDAAQVVLNAWDDEGNRETDIIGALEAPMANLRALLAGPALRATASAPRKQREGTKQEAVLALLRRAEGASGPQIAEATGWASHTVRGFLAGLKKKGIKVATIERVRQVGPNTEGAKKSYTVYQVAD
jgi:biotin operon repressor